MASQEVLAKIIRRLQKTHGKNWVAIASATLSDEDIRSLPSREHEQITQFRIEQIGLPPGAIETPEEPEPGEIPVFADLDIIDVEAGQFNGLTKHRPYGIVKLLEEGTLPAWPLGGQVLRDLGQLESFWTWKIGQSGFDRHATYKIVHLIGSTPGKPEERDESIAAIVFGVEELTGAQAVARAVTLAEERILKLLTRRRLHVDEIEITGVRYRGGVVITIHALSTATGAVGSVVITTTMTPDEELTRMQYITGLCELNHVIVQEEWIAGSSGSRALAIGAALQNQALREHISAIVQDAAYVDAIVQGRCSWNGTVESEKSQKDTDKTP